MPRGVAGIEGEGLSLVLVVGIVLSSCGAEVTGLARGGLHVYDDESATVVSPRVDANVQFSPALTVSPYWTADVITAATPATSGPDVITRATEFDEIRHEAGAGVQWQTERGPDWNASATVSAEPDYLATSTGVGTSIELLDEHATLVADLRGGWDSVGRADHAEFRESLASFGGGVGWKQILSPSLLAGLDLTLDVRNGFQESPYRYVAVWGDGVERPDLIFAEEVPELRVRPALEGSLAWAPAQTLFLQSAYRLYSDSWGVTAHTVRLDSWRAVADDRIRLRLFLRGHMQSEARFYSSRYLLPDGYRTSDFKLSSLRSLTAGTRFELRLSTMDEAARIVFAAGGDVTWYDYDNYPVRDTMTGVSLGTSVSFERF